MMEYNEVLANLASNGSTLRTKVSPSNGSTLRTRVSPHKNSCTSTSTLDLKHLASITCNGDMTNGNRNANGHASKQGLEAQRGREREAGASQAQAASPLAHTRAAQAFARAFAARDAGALARLFVEEVTLGSNGGEGPYEENLAKCKRPEVH